MNVVLNLVLVLQILSALAMIGLILVQHGKGADMGTAFGSGASGSLFGASGSANFLSRSTAVLATVFLASTLALAYFGFSVRSAPAGGGAQGSGRCRLCGRRHFSDHSGGGLRLRMEKRRPRLGISCALHRCGDRTTAHE